MIRFPLFRRLVILLLLASALSLARAEEEYYRYEPTKVADDIYLFRGTNVAGTWVTGNVVLIVNEHDALVVDSGFLPAIGRALVAEIKKITDKPVRTLVVTHWHGDHWQGNEAFAAAWPGLEIVMTEPGYRALLDKGMFWLNSNYATAYAQGIAFREEVLKSGKLPDGRAVTEADVTRIRKRVAWMQSEIAAMREVKPTLPTLTFSDQLVLRRGSREFHLHYLGTGNTAGDTVIYLPKERLLIPGDLVVYPSPYESDMFSREWLEVMRKLHAFEFDRVLPGHGPVLEGKAYIGFIIALFEEIIRQVNAAVQQHGSGTTLEQVQAAVTHDTVKAALAQRPEFADFLQQLSPGFVPDALHRAHPKAIAGKL
jgi:glyoxylase-like metal-dependent hydrolase (beta-lactamase superfamily II)